MNDELPPQSESSGSDRVENRPHPQTLSGESRGLRDHAGTCTRQRGWGELAIVLLLLGLCGGLLVARLTSAEPLGSANDRSRWCTVWSLATRGTYQIDEIIRYPGWDTIDKVRHEEHFYSTKPALYPTLLAGLYWSMQRLTGWNLLTDTHTVARWMLFWVNIVPYLVGLFCFWWALRICGYRPTTRVCVVAFGGLLTLLTPFLTVLNNHTAGATTLMFSLAAAIPLLIKRQPEECRSPNEVHSRDQSEEPLLQQEITPNTGTGSWCAGKAWCNQEGWLHAACGFFAALTCCHELPAALFGVAIFGLLAWRNWRTTLLWFVPAALIPLIGFFVTTYVATGGWKPFYMYYGTEKYEYEYRGVPSYWSNPQGLDRARDSVPAYIFHCLVGHHGIFSLTPLWLLVLPGWVIGWKQGLLGRKRLHQLGILLTVVILLFYWKRTENYNYGGVSVALRWVLWLIPFWLLAVAEWLDRMRSSLVVTGLVLLLGAPSVYSAWESWESPWQQPWLFKVMQARGWIDYSDPPPPLSRPVSGWLNDLPDREQTDPDYWCEFLDGQGQLLRLADAGPITHESQAARIMQVELRDTQGNILRSRTFVLSPEQVRAGADPSEYLLAWEDSLPEATRADQERFLRGVPVKARYRAGHIRYQFTAARDHAYQCRRVATRTLRQADRGAGLPALETRADLWLSDDVPFGLVHMQISITNRATQQMAWRDSWTLIASGWEQP